MCLLSSTISFVSLESFLPTPVSLVIHHQFIFFQSFADDISIIRQPIINQTRWFHVTGTKLHRSSRNTGSPQRTGGEWWWNNVYSPTQKVYIHSHPSRASVCADQQRWRFPFSICSQSWCHSSPDFDLQACLMYVFLLAGIQKLLWSGLKATE